VGQETDRKKPQHHVGAFSDLCLGITPVIPFSVLPLYYLLLLFLLFETSCFCMC